ncbi:MAG: ATP-binding protein [Planctomycetota bacterium]|nr:ATP-binding protein [Planctomycetota bacterium]
MPKPRKKNVEDQEERASRLAYVGTLASGLAHEIRSPLNSMRLNLDLLREQLEKVEPGARDSFRTRLDLIDREVEGLQHLLTEFLKFARPPQMQPLATDINHLVGQVLELVTPECQQAHIEIVRDFQEDLYPVPVDQAQLGRGVLLNLLTNAREQIGEHGTITVRTRDRDDAIEVHVEDNGGGVPQELEEKVFQAFESTKEHGTGLGLPIARRIVMEHGGTLTLENKPGLGANFVVRLPKSKILEYNEGKQPQKSRGARK